MSYDGWVLVDDRDPGIAYGGPPGATLWHGGVAQEYDQTTTGLDQGDTATYYFNASSIAVFGTYGPDDSGPPVAVYQVDNTPATTVTAPTGLQTTMYRQNFWTSDPQLPSLAPGAFHTLVVTATAQNNTLWIDYLAYPPPNATSSTASTSSSSSTGSSATLFTSATSTTSLTPTSITSQTAETSSTKTNSGAIIAGIVVGAFAFILATAALVMYMRRRRSRPTAREYLMQGGNDVSPTMSQNPRTTTLSPFTQSSEAAPSYSSILQPEGSLHEYPRPLPPVPTRTFDGGVRLMGGSVDIPPEYQEHY